MTTAAAVGKKSNKAFMLLSALGILFVIDSHMGPNFSLILKFFPYDSFFMPMFAFISGYFFSEKHIRSWKQVLQFSVKKVKTLMVPYFLWIVFYGIVVNVLSCLNLFEISDFSLIDLVYNIATSGTSFYFNDPAWFVPLLFCVIISYTLIRKVFDRCWDHYIAMILFILLGTGALAFTQTESFRHILLMPVKVLVFLQYYHLGILFKEKLEKQFDKLNPIVICALSVAVNYVLISIYGTNIGVPMYATLDGYAMNNHIIPLIAAAAGIAFWLKICKCLASVLGQSKILNFISDNTFFFMTHHLAVKHIFLGILIVLQSLGLCELPGFQMDHYRMYAWYNYKESFLLSVLCPLFTMIVLSIFCTVFLKLQKKAAAICSKIHG